MSIGPKKCEAVGQSDAQTNRYRKSLIPSATFFTRDVGAAGRLSR